MFGSQGPTFPDKVTVLVADATPMDCQLVSEAIQRHNHFRVIDRVVSSSQTISAVRKAQPDVAVISARLQDGAFAGLLALRGLRAFPTRSRIVVVLDRDERELVVEAFLNNARGVFCRIGIFRRATQVYTKRSQRRDLGKQLSDWSTSSRL